MTKAAVCGHCMDIVSPRRAWQTDRSWRWCECDHAGVRWADGDRGLLEVTAVHGPDKVFVLGLNNDFLFRGIRGVQEGVRTAEQWRELHQQASANVPAYYLFHQDRRDCWALLIRPGETGDVTFVSYADALKAIPVSSTG